MRGLAAVIGAAAAAAAGAAAAAAAAGPAGAAAAAAAAAGPPPPSVPADHACTAPNVTGLPFCDPSLPIAARVSDLLSRLTTAEKLALSGSSPGTDMCSTLDGGAPRLGIPPTNVLIEINSGVSATCYGNASAGCPSVFPSSLNLGATFNRTAWAAKGAVVSDEMRALNNLRVPRRIGPQYTVSLHGFGPNINTVVDPRYGRNGELVSEDPFLTGAYATEYVRGLQGPTPAGFANGTAGGGFLKVASYLKHYAAYNVETLRMAFGAPITMFDLHDTYLPAYGAAMGFARGAAPAAGAPPPPVASGAMCSYMSIAVVNASGAATPTTPCCASPYLLGDVMRGYWGNAGAVIVSDCDAVANEATQNHYAPNLTVAAAVSLAAGLDVNDGIEYAGGALAAALAAGLVPESDLDAALSRTLTLRMALGYFDPPAGQPFTSYGPEKLGTPAAKALIDDVAAQSFVLLKNDAGALPLDAAALSSVAVVGPHANYGRGLLGDFYGDDACPGGPTDASCVPTIAAALEQALQGTSASVLVAPGVSIVGNDTSGIPPALAAVAAADVVLLCLGNDAVSVEHEGVDRPSSRLPGIQATFAAQVVAAASAVGAKVVVVLVNAGALAIDDLAPTVPAIVEAFYPTFGAPALIRTLLGASNRWGRLPYTVYPASYDDAVWLIDMAVAVPPGGGGGGFPGRTYRYFTGTPLFPFGTGLSYSNFTLACTGGGAGPGPTPPPSFTVPVSCAVGLAAGPPGDEVLLVHHRVGADVARAVGGAHAIPISSLVEFGRVAVPAGGATVPLAWTLPVTALALTDAAGASVVYPGTHFFDVVPRTGSNVTLTVTWTAPAPTVLTAPPIPAGLA
jgi:xylan 1,4-beta-xylosidase